MKLIFHGAAQTVTGSLHLVEVNGSRLLLDCGLFQGKRREAYERNRKFPIVSWQSPETLGRRLADRETRVKIMGETYRCRAEIATIGGLSAHAGQDSLIEYASAVKGKADAVFLIHGEERGALPLKEKLRENRVKHVYYPTPHSSAEL